MPFTFDVMKRGDGGYISSHHDDWKWSVLHAASGSRQNFQVTSPVIKRGCRRSGGLRCSALIR